jgi:tungstate transport system permease protein
VSGPDAAAIVEITLRSLRVSLTALLFAVGLGVPVGIWLGTRGFPGRRFLVALINSGMGAPPVVVGLGVALLLWRNQPLGGLGLMYTPAGMVIAQVVIALPLVVGISLAAVGGLGESWHQQVRTLGIPRVWRLWLLVREVRLGLSAAVIAALGAILSEVGAVLMVGGNLEGETRVLTTAIMMHTQMGEFGVAMGLSAVLVGLMLLLTGLLTFVQQGGRR